MSIPNKLFRTFRISVDQCPQKLLIRKTKFCEYLRFHPANNFPRSLKLRMLRYFKQMIVWGVKFKDEVSKPFQIYRQIFQRFKTMIHCRVDFMPLNIYPMKDLFLSNKVLNYHFLTNRNASLPKYCRKTTNLLIHPTLNLESYLKFLKRQRHFRDSLSNVYIRSNDANALNETVGKACIGERFPNVKKWTLFLNFNTEEQPNFQFKSYPCWQNLLWAYIAIDRISNFGIFLKNVDQMKDLYSLELAYYGVNQMSNFDFSLFQKFESLVKIKMFSLQINLTQLKDIKKFWLNLRFPPNVQDLGFNVTHAQFVTSDSYDPEFLNAIRKTFINLTRVVDFDAKLQFNEKLTTVHSYLLAAIVSCFTNLKTLFLILVHFRKEADLADQLCYLSLIYPVLSTLKDLTFFHFQGKSLDRIYQKGTLSVQTNPNLENLSIIASEVKDHEFMSFFEDSNYKKISKLRMNVDTKLNITPEQFGVLVSKISEMKDLDQLSLSLRGKVLEEDIVRFFLVIKDLKLIYTLKFDAMDTELKESSITLIKNILIYHRNLLNISVKLNSLNYNGNKYSYRVTL